MEYQTLGKTGLMVSHTALELIELHERDEIEAYSALLQEAYEAGINFFAVNAKYKYSLEALGAVFGKVRKDVHYYIFSNAVTISDLTDDIENSLYTLRCDSVEFFSLNAPETLLSLGELSDLYKILSQAKEIGKIKHIALHTVSVNSVREAVISGLYELVSYGFSVSATKADEDIVNLCESMEIGFTALNPDGDDSLLNIPLSFGYLNQFENIVPLWCLTSQEKLQKVLYFANHPPINDDKFKQELDAFRT